MIVAPSVRAASRREATSHRSHRVGAVILVLAATLTLSACAGSQTAEPQPETPAQSQAAPTPIDELNLLTPPSALNLDDSPGVDGFAARVFAVRSQPFATIAIDSGELEILLFDGLVRRRDVAETEPRQTWTLAPDQLTRYEESSAVGVGYSFTLRWDTDEPFESDDLTIIARYLPPGDDGRPVYSAPVSLSRRAR